MNASGKTDKICAKATLFLLTWSHKGGILYIQIYCHNLGVLAQSFLAQKT